MNKDYLPPKTDPIVKEVKRIIDKFFFIAFLLTGIGATISIFFGAYHQIVIALIGFLGAWFSYKETKSNTN